jgi:2-oxo-4-hydroxy-4-carboxy-5-ureidoimidazoline decarboxylase
VTIVLNLFNTAEPGELRAPLQACCEADPWVDAILAGRPYADEAALCTTSDRATASLDDVAIGQALSGYPRIGSLWPDHGWSRQEQALLADASETFRADIAAANEAYERRFGHIYLVYAPDHTREELLDLCRCRMRNEPAVERAVLLGELAKINQARLRRLLHPAAVG